MRIADQVPDAAYPWLLCHVQGRATDPGAAVLFESRISEVPRLAITGCADCTAQPRKVPAELTPASWLGAVTVEHDASCPALAAALRRKDGQR